MNIADNIFKVGQGAQAGGMGLLIFAGIGVAVYVVYKTSQGISLATDTVKKVIVEDINPVKQDNIFNQAANFLTGNDNENSSIGTSIYDFFN